MIYGLLVILILMGLIIYFMSVLSREMQQAEQRKPAARPAPKPRQWPAKDGEKRVNDSAGD